MFKKKYKSKFLPRFLQSHDDYLSKVYSTWLFINSHRERRAHGFSLSLLRLISDRAAIFTSILNVSFSLSMNMFLCFSIIKLTMSY